MADETSSECFVGYSTLTGRTRGIERRHGSTRISNVCVGDAIVVFDHALFRDGDLSHRPKDKDRSKRSRDEGLHNVVSKFGFVKADQLVIVRAISLERRATLALAANLLGIL